MQVVRELAPDGWSEYFDALSVELLGAPASIEVTVSEGSSMVEADRLALQALAYDRRDDVFEIAVASGGPPLPSVLRHLVDRPERIGVDTDTLLAPITIEVDSRDGARTVIRIEREELVA